MLLGMEYKYKSIPLFFFLFDVKDYSFSIQIENFLLQSCHTKILWEQ